MKRIIEVAMSTYRVVYLHEKKESIVLSKQPLVVVEITSCSKVEEEMVKVLV